MYLMHICQIKVFSREVRAWRHLRVAVGTSVEDQLHSAVGWGLGQNRIIRDAVGRMLFFWLSSRRFHLVRWQCPSAKHQRCCLPAGSWQTARLRRSWPTAPPLRGAPEPERPRGVSTAAQRLTSVLQMAERKRPIKTTKLVRQSLDYFTSPLHSHETHQYLINSVPLFSTKLEHLLPVSLLALVLCQTVQLQDFSCNEFLKEEIVLSTSFNFRLVPFVWQTGTCVLVMSPCIFTL